MSRFPVGIKALFGGGHGGGVATSICAILEAPVALSPGLSPDPP